MMDPNAAREELGAMKATVAPEFVKGKDLPQEQRENACHELRKLVGMRVEVVGLLNGYGA